MKLIQIVVFLQNCLLALISHSAYLLWIFLQLMSILSLCNNHVNQDGYICIQSYLTHLGRVTHICVSKLTVIGSDNGLSPGRRQAIIWTNAGILLIGPLETNFSQILIEIYKFSFKKMHLKMSSGKWRPFCLGPNVLNGAHNDAKFASHLQWCIQFLHTIWLHLG